MVLPTTPVFVPAVVEVQSSMIRRPQGVAIPGSAGARTAAGCLVIAQAAGAAGIEPHDPVADDLRRQAANPGGLAPAAAIVYLRQRQNNRRA